MTKPFKFKTFEIIQEKNHQKVGTDSMLLGAWSSGNFECILDIGTGTGILALMLAQQNISAHIRAIEPETDSFEEALRNFLNSAYKDRILGIQTTLQRFECSEKFDLIICNPPYYDNSYLSQNQNRNKVRHTCELAVHELYESGSNMLSDNGLFNVVVPFTEEAKHTECASDNKLYIKRILHTLREEGSKKRSLISFSFDEVEPLYEELLVKYSNNQYSPEYVELTKAFYHKNLK